MQYFIEAITKKYAMFEGRARRKEYWMFTLFYTIFYSVLYLPAMAMRTAASVTGEASVMGMIFICLAVIYSLALIVPSIALVVRRLHDTGRSGWWYFISFVPCVGSILMLIFVGFTDSQPGTNQYGENPKEM